MEVLLKPIVLPINLVRAALLHMFIRYAITAQNPHELLHLCFRVMRFFRVYLVLVAKPGAGKTTSMRICSQTAGEFFQKFTTSEVLDEFLQTDAARNQFNDLDQIRSTKGRGGLIRDEVALAAMCWKMETADQSRIPIWDGGMRSPPQLFFHLKEAAKQQRYLVCLHFDIDDDLAKARSQKRSLTENRVDNGMEEQRLTEFEKKTRPAIKLAKAQARLGRMHCVTVETDDSVSPEARTFIAFLRVSLRLLIGA